MFPKNTIIVKRITLWLSLTILFACSVVSTENSLPYYNSPDFSPYWIKNETELQNKISHRIGNFSFLNQEGIVVTQEIIKDKIHVANFFFTTCPGICPAMTNQFEKVQSTFCADDDIRLLSFSVTPEIDSVQKLHEYASIHHVQKDKWHLLTGDKKKIYELARKSYFAEQEKGYLKDSSKFLHSEYLILVDKRQYIRGIYNGTLPEETDRLIADIYKLK